MQDEFFFFFALESVYFTIFESPSVGSSSHFPSVELQTFEQLYTGVPHFIALYRALQILHFYKLKVYGDSALSDDS